MSLSERAQRFHPPTLRLLATSHRHPVRHDYDSLLQLLPFVLIVVNFMLGGGLGGSVTEFDANEEIKQSQNGLLNLVGIQKFFNYDPFTTS